MDVSRAFEYVAAQQVLTSYGIDDDETLRGLVGEGNDGGYDGIFLFVNEVLYNGEDLSELDLPHKASIDIHFIQAKHQMGFGESIVQNWKDSFPNLVSEGKPDRQRYSEGVIEAFALVREILTKTITNRLKVSINFWAVSLAEEVHPNLIKQAEELKEKVSGLIPAKNTEVEVNYVTASRLFEMIGRSPDEIVTLTGAKEPLCPDDSSAIIMVKLRDFNSFTTDDDGNLKKVLFEANIRDYQGNVDVNKAIRKTLQDEGAIDFWWLNNGVTIVADAVTRDMGNAITLLNPRIVNGLQTSNEIWQYCKTAESEMDERKVLVKCIAAGDPEARAQIIQATNNQSSIPPAYLRSLETIHFQIEQYFKRHGLHYDRRKSSCKNEGIPAKDIISVPFLGQCLIATLLQQPDYARARPARIFGDESRYKKIFNKDIPLETFFRLGKISLHVRQYLKTSGMNSGAQNDLIFYVIFAVCALQAGKFEITPEDLQALEAPSDKDMQTVIDLVYGHYQKQGNSVIVKNASFTGDIRSLIEQEGLLDSNQSN